MFINCQQSRILSRKRTIPLDGRVIIQLEEENVHLPLKNFLREVKTHPLQLSLDLDSSHDKRIPVDDILEELDGTRCSLGSISACVSSDECVRIIKCLRENTRKSGRSVRTINLSFPNKQHNFMPLEGVYCKFLVFTIPYSKDFEVNGSGDSCPLPRARNESPDIIITGVEDTEKLSDIIKYYAPEDKTYESIRLRPCLPSVSEEDVRKVCVTLQADGIRTSGRELSPGKISVEKSSISLDLRIGRRLNWFEKNI